MRESVFRKVLSLFLCGVLLAGAMPGHIHAEELETEIQAEVTLGENCIPVSVTIAGSISPQNRSRLSQVIASELGIPKEQQEWIG